MAIKVVKKRAASSDAQPRPGAGKRRAPRASTPRRQPAGGSPVGWLVVGALAVVAAVVMLLVIAGNRPDASADSGTRFVYPADMAPRQRAKRRGQDRITASMGGKSMRDWCAEQDKTNEMVQARRTRRTKRSQ